MLLRPALLLLTLACAPTEAATFTPPPAPIVVVVVPPAPRGPRPRLSSGYCFPTLRKVGGEWKGRCAA
jgi:hypothetical protein